MKRIIFSSVLLAALAALLLAGSALAEPKGTLTIFQAGSLSVPLDEMEKAFEAKYPGVDIVRTAGGSTKMARLISQDGKAADIMASADYVVIDKNLIPKFASWNARFATNQMVLCYTDKSKYADEVNAQNWMDILLKKDVSWGHSDPNLDPCGYRSLMVLQLAEKFYGKEGFYAQAVANRPAENVLPKAVQLVELLKSGKLDYGWEYLSVAVQKGLKYVQLDSHINLGDYAMDAFYKQATVEVTGKKPGETITRTGSSITYGITLLNDAPNREAAEAFLEYLFSPEGGLKVLESLGQPPFSPVRVSSEADLAAMPENLKPLVEVSK